MLGKLRDHLEQNSFWPLIDNPFVLPYHGTQKLCPIMSFIEADNSDIHGFFHEHFWSNPWQTTRI